MTADRETISVTKDTADGDTLLTFDRSNEGGLLKSVVMKGSAARRAWGILVSIFTNGDGNGEI